MGRSPTGGSRRKPQRREQRRRYLLACEGETEVAYFKHLNRRMGGSIKLVPVHDKSAPERVVDLAVTERDADVRAARAAGDPSEVYDGVWAVVDIDEHTHLVEAIAQAGREDVHVAISGPCFETWLVLHLETRTAAFSTPKTAKDRWKKLTAPARTLEPQLTRLDGNLQVAIDRAAALTSRHGSVPRHKRNPSSEVGALTTTICSESSINTAVL